MKKKQILVNAYTHLNLGDDLFLKILFERYPSVDFTLMANKNIYKEVFKTNNVSYLTFPKTFLDQKLIRRVFGKFFKYHFLKSQYNAKKRYLKKKQHLFDATITIGGSIFMEKSDKRLNKLNISQLFLDLFPQKPKFIIGSNFGPFKNDAFVEYYEELFAGFTDVCFRDAYSISLFNQLDNVRYHSDVVFSANFKTNSKIPNTVGFSLIDISRRVGLSQYNDDYQKLIVRLLNIYIEKGFTPYLFSFCEYEGDERVINKILGLIDPEQGSKVKTVFYKGNIEGFINDYSKIEVMYATRFHAMILGLMFEQKLHPIIYSKKMTDVLEDISYKGNYTDINNINNSTAERAALNNDSYIFDIKLQEDALKQFNELTKYINS